VASRAASRRKRLGSETPRISTPPLRDLTPQTSLGFAAIEFATDVCGIDLYPWQRWLLIHALELDPALTVDTIDQRGRLDPIFRFRKVVVLVARQNGKSTLSQVLSLFFLYILGTDLILGTAQDLDTAEEVWDGALEIIEETPELAALADKPIRVNGKKTIRLHSGERYKVKAANRRAGRGLSGDLILLDELREHQSWDAWGAITKTTQARPAAMIWALSNAGDATSVVLRYLRKAAHAALGDPDGINADDDPSLLLPTADEVDDLEDLADAPGDDLEPEDFEEDVDTLGLFEWSAPPGCSVMDRDGWAQSNPSMGHGIAERTIAGDAKGDPEWVFRTEVLCQWSDGSLEGPFPPGTWDGCQDPASKIATGGTIIAAVDVSWDRTHAHVAIAGLREDGLPHVGVVASRAGVDWVIPWLTGELEGVEVPPFESVVVQERGAAASDLIDPLESAGLKVTRWGGSDLPTGTGAFYEAVRGGGLRHRGQPVLDVAAATAVPKLTDGGSFIWDRRKSPVDIAPLVAVTGALWGVMNRPKPTRSIYEDRGLELV
jgi:hypothetical protein